jgi:putative addiction module killer protein
VQARIDRMAFGHPGGAKPVGEGIHEMRIGHGPGYRVYFMHQGARVVVLLCAGDKSTQDADIKPARRMPGSGRSRHDGRNVQPL